MGRDGTLVKLMPLDRKVVCSNPVKAATRDLGQVLHLQLPVALRAVNSAIEISGMNIIFPLSVG